MTTTFLLVRHAAHDNLGSYLAGRTMDVSLGSDGRQQAGLLAERLTRVKVDAIHTSPRKRTQETARAIGAARGLLRIEIDDALDEVDFGHWAGESFETLDIDPLWRRWNAVRSLARTAGGETMLDVEKRVMELIETLEEKRRDETILLVSHAEVIKAAVCHVLGLPANASERFEIAPASVSRIVVGEWGAKILNLNERV